MKGLASSTEPFGPVFIHPLIHLENLYSAPSRKLLRGAHSPTTMKKISFKPLVEQRCVGLALWYSNRICEGSEFQIHFPSPWSFPYHPPRVVRRRRRHFVDILLIGALPPPIICRRAADTIVAA